MVVFGRLADRLVFFVHISGLKPCEIFRQRILNAGFRVVSISANVLNAELIAPLIEQSRCDGVAGFLRCQGDAEPEAFAFDKISFFDRQSNGLGCCAIRDGHISASLVHHRFRNIKIIIQFDLVIKSSGYTIDDTGGWFLRKKSLAIIIQYHPVLAGVAGES